MSKIQKDHLNRAAYIYVRQSSLSQVEQNLESQRRQYALVERAKDLGWHDIRVVDEDLGRSGSGKVERRGFEALLADVCQGQVGGVFAVEASRLARNGHDWHRLLEFCQIVDTLIVDHDGIYDPKHPNDRLVLGLKGTIEVKSSCRCFGNARRKLSGKRHDAASTTRALPKGTFLAKAIFWRKILMNRSDGQ
jgi:DNA invertase Pin-like site-specific DNA recombinase